MKLAPVYNDYKYRLKVSKYKLYLQVYKFLLDDSRVSFKCKSFLLVRLTSFKKFLSRSRLSNFCFLTGNSGNVFSKYKQSRHQFRFNSRLGSISGIRKSSW